MKLWTEAWSKDAGSLLAARCATAVPTTIVATKLTITRQTGETVLEGEAWCYTFNPGGTPGRLIL